MEGESGGRKWREKVEGESGKLSTTAKGGPLVESDLWMTSDATLCWTETHSPKIKPCVAAAGSGGRVTALCFSPAGTVLASGSSRGMVRCGV